PLAVYEERLLRLLLGAVDVRPGGAVHDGLRPRLCDRLTRAAWVGHVQLAACQRDCLVTGGRRSLRQVLAEHSAGAADEDLHGLSLADAARPPPRLRSGR